MEYAVVDTKTSAVISLHATRKSASRKVDRLDMAYGGYRYTVRAVPSQQGPAK